MKSSSKAKRAKAPSAKPKKSKRPPVSETNKLLVWARAAGRCTLCNRLVTRNADLGELVSIGELAHNVGWSRASPRGKSKLSSAERSAPSNLLLVCGSCHKPPDLKKVAERYTISRLAELKRHHEQRIEQLTSVGADRQAVLFRVVGEIRGTVPSLTYDDAQDALLDWCMFPGLLPQSVDANNEIDLLSIPDSGTPKYYSTCASLIDGFTAKLNDAIRKELVQRVAVFGFARIPPLVHLGARLDDKIPVSVFQRHRRDSGNPWRWPSRDKAPAQFRFTKKSGSGTGVSIILNVSGSIPESDLPADLGSHSIYLVDPSPPFAAGPTLIASPSSVENFELVVRELLAEIERAHGRLSSVAVFPALPVSAAVTLGRTLMPNVSPTLDVYDRDAEGKFFLALRVSK